MKKVLAMIGAVLLLTGILSCGVMAAPPLVLDQAQLLSQSQYERLLSEAVRISDKEDCDVAILTVYGTEGKDIVSYADDFYDYNGYGQNSSRDGILFVIDMNSREWAFSTAGNAIGAFTDAGLQRLEKAVIPYLSENRFGDGLAVYLSECEELLDMAHAGNPYDSTFGTSQTGMKDELIKILFCLIVGILGAIAPMNRLKSQNKNVTAMTTAGNYVQQGSLSLYRTADNFLYRNVTAVPIPKSPPKSGIGGSSIHVGSSGMSHGGSHGKF